MESSIYTSQSKNTKSYW